MPAKGGLIERLGEHVGVIEIGRHVFDDHLALGNELAHLEVTALDMARTHLYEYGLPHAGIGSLPYMRLLVVEHLRHDEYEEE